MKTNKLKQNIIRTTLIPATIIINLLPTPMVAEIDEFKKPFIQDIQKLQQEIPKKYNKKISDLTLRILNEDKNVGNILFTSLMNYIKRKNFICSDINNFINNYDAIKSLAEKISKKRQLSS